MSMTKKVEKNARIVRDEENSEILSKVNKATETLNSILAKNYENLEFEDLEGFRSHYSGKAAGSGCLTIINHPKDGVRLHVANEIWRDLGCPQYLRPVIAGGDLLLFVGNDNNVAVKFNKTMDFEEAVANYKSKIVLYASKTAKRLVAEWNLDKSGGCCFTGGVYAIKTIKGVEAAVIVFKHDSEESSSSSSDDASAETAEVKAEK